MATRFYLPSVGVAPFDPVPANGGWERDSAAYIARSMVRTKSNSALTTLSATFGATATSQTRYYTGVSEQLDVGQTISGTVSMVIGKCGETSTSGDAHLCFSLRVTDDVGTHQAILLQFHSASTEFPLIASAATRIHNGRAITGFAAAAGDRIVCEIGIHGVTPANQVMQMRIGDPAAVADFALTAALTTDLVPWVELSATLTFAGAGPAGQPSSKRLGGVLHTPGNRSSARRDW